jgi:hypothetical protein
MGLRRQAARRQHVSHPGVTWDKRAKGWTAQILLTGRASGRYVWPREDAIASVGCGARTARNQDYPAPYGGSAAGSCRNAPGRFSHHATPGQTPGRQTPAEAESPLSSRRQLRCRLSSTVPGGSSERYCHQLLQLSDVILLREAPWVFTPRSRW